MEFILFINKLHFYISYIPSMCIFYFHTIIWRSVTSKSWFERMSMCRGGTDTLRPTLASWPLLGSGQGVGRPVSVLALAQLRPPPLPRAGGVAGVVLQHAPWAAAL